MKETKNALLNKTSSGPPSTLVDELLLVYQVHDKSQYLRVILVYNFIIYAIAYIMCIFFNKLI